MGAGLVWIRVWVWVCVCVWMVHGNLTGANIAPEGGEWALDWCGFDCLPALVGKCTVAITPGNPASGTPHPPYHPHP